LDDNELSAMRAMSAGIQAARRLAVYLWKTHYSTQSPDWKLADDLHGVISQIDNMTAGLVKPALVNHERQHIVRNILYRNLPAHIDANICRDICGKILRALFYQQPDFRERMETFFRRHNMDDKEMRQYDQNRAQAGATMARTIQPPLRQQLEGAEAPLSAFAGGFTDEQLKLDPVLRYFHYAHLPPMLQPTSAIFCRAARYVVEALPRNAERTVALRKLLEAKDAAVRANVEFTHPAPTRQETFLDRLHQEYGELNERKAKLWAFITSLGGFSDLPAAEQVRLRQQHTVMDQYAQILIERISCATEQSDRTTSRIPPDIQCEQIDENVRVTGGGKSEEPLPFSD
jgi:hypothetical protein